MPKWPPKVLKCARRRGAHSCRSKTERKREMESARVQKGQEEENRRESITERERVRESEIERAI